MAEIPYVGADASGELDPFADGSVLGQRSKWDTITIAGQLVDGVAKVRPSGARLKVDEKKAPGKNGASPTFHGREPASVDITITVSTAAQQKKLVALLAKIWPADPTKARPKPFDVYHPSLAPLGIKSIYLVECGGLEPVSRGALQVALRAREYRKSSAKANATTKPTASVENVIEPKRLKQAGNATPALPSQQTAARGPR